ncbi:MAG: hypothetical protein HC813_02880 [Planctomycetes bacterium]|nr:hypothetical protein [Planctomycetota bacterium]
MRAALLGADRLSDAVNVAFKVPNLLRDLFAEGAFSGAFVPTLAARREREGPAAALELFNRVLSTLFVYVGILVLLLALFAPAIVTLLTDAEFSGDREQFTRTVLLVRLLSPFLLFISFAVAAMGTLNVSGHFFLPALSPATQNLLLVVGGLLLYFGGLRGGASAVPWALLLLAGASASSSSRCRCFAARVGSRASIPICACARRRRARSSAACSRLRGGSPPPTSAS